MRTADRFLFLLLLSSLALTLKASDWPQFLGPTRNGVYPGTLDSAWPKDGPPVVWHKKVGHGFSGPVIAAGNLILFQRVGDKEVIECMDPQSGTPKWSKSYATSYSDDFGFDDGPRATPCVSGGKIYTFGAEGMLTCLDLADGKMTWQADTKKAFHPAKGFFGAACSPLVEGHAVLMDIGGHDEAGIVAFDATNGSVLWKTSADEASYSAPIAATIENRRYALFFTRAGLVGLTPEDGKTQFDYHWRSTMNASVNAATPIVINDTIFLSACYGTGAIMLRVHDNKLEKIWSGDDILSNHYATSIYADGFLYGINGRADPGFSPAPSLRCIEAKTGKIRWDESSIGAATVSLAGTNLIVLTESGELIRAAASANAFKALDRSQVMPNGVRAYPALADGFLYARCKDALYCIDLNPKK